MRSVIKKIFRKLGFQVSRNQALPYEYLLKTPRYRETSVELLGDEFRIPDGKSFYWIYREIFLSEIYKFIAPTASPAIVDCGANCGMSIVYFKKLYPEARIIAVEADPNIFSLLKWNVTRRKFRDVTLINKAISNDINPVTFFSEGADAGRIHALEGAQATFLVDPIKLDSLIENPIDFLKIDIEGGETEALCSSVKLDNVSQLIVEYHQFEDEGQTLIPLLEKLSSHGFRYYIHTVFCSPRPLTERSCQFGMDLQLNIFAMKDLKRPCT